MTDILRDVPGFFAEWFEEVWGYEPFPWQTEFVAEVSETWQWPELVDLPTGTGKTSIIDIAVFLQAVDALANAGDLRMPRRIVSVVDRRIVVDQAADRARSIADALSRAKAGSRCRVVADALRMLSMDKQHATDDIGAADSDPPLLVSTLRGAIANDESWLRRPDVPAVLASTIDQVGSRLLFRGYGISRAMRPIHAGLLGNDVLWLLDEVHLARPFSETLHSLTTLNDQFEGNGLPRRWQVVEMTATPTRPVSRRFPRAPLDPASHELIGRRIRAHKPTVIPGPVKVPSDPAKADEKFAAACATEAKKLVSGSARTIGVIVNRVDTARLVHQQLQAQSIDSHLLTGRMRPIDRDRFFQDHGSRIANGRSRVTDDAPFVLVSTQCIEAGADLDLDAIVTEVASLDALVQRFGRVDRSGDVSHVLDQHDSAQDRYSSVVLARSNALDGDDPIYGDALKNTWTWLREQDKVDFGIAHQPTPEDGAGLVAEPNRAPVLLATHLDQLAQTSQAVSADPDISRWLHGMSETTSPDVLVVWRADIDDDFIHQVAAERSDRLTTALTDRLAACPPATTEALSVPISAARRWLAGQPAIVSDIDGREVDPEERPATARHPWVTWRRGEAIARSFQGDEPIPRDALRPGDVVVVPTERGGLSSGNWDPTSTQPVSDLAEQALHREQRLEVARFHPALIDLSASDIDWPTASVLESLPVRDRNGLVKQLMEAALAVPGLTNDDLARLEALRDSPVRRRLAVWPAGASWSVPGTRDQPIQRTSLIVSAPSHRPDPLDIQRGAPKQSSQESTGEEALSGVDSDGDEEGASFTGAASDLVSHQDGVRDWARVIGERLGFPEGATKDLGLAGQHHDEGKRDRRFQVILHHGDELAAAASANTPLAKSKGRQPSLARRRQIRLASGYPRGARHEFTSLALATTQIETAADPELVAHLVASHHGWCRPFAPPLIDANPVQITGPDGTEHMSDHDLQAIDADPPQRFWALNAQYGWYGLAWLEAVLRLGDHRQSESEGRQAKKDTK